MTRHATFAAAVLACSATLLFAQQAAPPFRAGVDAVFVPVWVTEGRRPVTGLASADFELTDNGVLQEVSAAAAEALAVDVTLVLDTSGSVKGRALDQFKEDVQAIALSLAPNDRVRLVTFDAHATDVFGLLPGSTRLPVEMIQAGGPTSFYNALAAALMAFPPIDHPQLIFSFSDALDTSSFLDAARVTTLAGYSGASLYLALSVPPGSGVDLRPLRDAAARTGGMLYELRPGASMSSQFQRVLEDFRTSYVLTYTLRGVKPAGWHELTVTVKGRRYNVRARQGYEGG